MFNSLLLHINFTKRFFRKNGVMNQAKSKLAASAKSLVYLVFLIPYLSFLCPFYNPCLMTMFFKSIKVLMTYYNPKISTKAY